MKNLINLIAFIVVLASITTITTYIIMEVFIYGSIH
jgi:hypothetical protein